MRAAFGFLVAAAAINLMVALTGTVGSAESVAALSAARHALAQGFLLPVIVFMAARILPGYSPHMMAHPGKLDALMVALLVGALLRAGGELVGGYSEGWGIAATRNAKNAPVLNMANAHWRLGQIYAATARKDLARAEYNESLRINPENQAVKKSLEALK